MDAEQYTIAILMTTPFDKQFAGSQTYRSA